MVEVLTPQNLSDIKNQGFPPTQSFCFPNSNWRAGHWTSTPLTPIHRYMYKSFLLPFERHVHTSLGRWGNDIGMKLQKDLKLTDVLRWNPACEITHYLWALPACRMVLHREGRVGGRRQREKEGKRRREETRKIHFFPKMVYFSFIYPRIWQYYKL